MTTRILSRSAISKTVLCSAVRRRRGLFLKGTEKLKEWRLGNFNLHWFEPVGEDEYLIACDELYVIRLNVKDRRPPVVGKRLTRDDLST